jgi:hypothetical protein
MKTYLSLLLFSLTLINGSIASAGGVYQEPADFINQVFDDNPPKPDVLWLDKELKQQITEILDHKYKGLRVRYWSTTSNLEQPTTNRTAWILEEVGKEKPITTGIVINNEKIELVKVLVFRESRGWEVRHDFFTNQFKQISLKPNHQLDKSIDNISGATLSVRAINKLARIALLLDKKIHKKVGNENQ